MRAINPRESAADQELRPPASKLRIFLYVVFPIVALVAAIAAFMYLRSTKPEVAKRPIREQVYSIASTEVAVVNHRPRLQLFGEARPGRQVELRALVAGEVTATGDGFLEGGVVRKGDLLLQLDPFEYDAALSEARANLAETRARLAESEARIVLERDQLAEVRNQYDLAMIDLERARPLVTQELLSQKAVDDRQVVVSQRDQAVKQRESSVAIETARAEQQRAVIGRLETSVARAERNLANTKLVAPFDAYVSAKGAEVGRLVGVNDPVATLIDTDRMDVRFNLSDARYGRIVKDSGGLVGRPVRVVWRVGGGAAEYTAKIERVVAEISAASGGVDVYAGVDGVNGEGSGIPLRAGAWVEIYLDDMEFADVITLPESALYGGDTVYVIEDSRLKSRTVELVGYSGGNVLVRGGLKPGEKVNTTRISEIGDGLRVEVR